MTITLSDIADWTGGRICGGDPQREIRGFSVDSRTAAPDELFVALRGPNFDGHDFIAEALGKGVAGAVSHSEEALGGGPGLVVDNTLHALGDIAHHYRWQERLIPWVGITGSNGKTTTREMLRIILASKGEVAYSPGNFNNLVGLPLSILQAPAQAWAGVLELGTSQRGEIARLAQISTPTVAVLTSVGPAHVEGLGSLREVCEEKAAIFNRLPHDGIAVYPADCPCQEILQRHVHGRAISFGICKGADLVAEDITLETDCCRFRVRGVEFELPALGRHNVLNCLAALCAAEHLGVSLPEAADALKRLRPVRDRLQVIKGRYFTILNDVYNANPDSLRAAVEAMDLFDPGMRRVVIVGDMLELGQRSRKYHVEAGQYLASKNIALILAVGKFAVALAEGAAKASAKPMVRHFRSLPMLIRRDERHVKSGDLILVKGSRAMHMEKLIDTLLEWRP